MSIPSKLFWQLIYRMEREEPYETRSIEGCDFHFISSPFGLLPFFASGKSVFGMLGFIKTLLKLVTAKRDICIYTKEKQILHYSWLNHGFCGNYWVDSADTVIGPIWSHADSRGLGLATETMKRAVNHSLEKGYKVFFIDTSFDNIACQKAIAKVGFGAPVAVFLRGYVGKNVMAL